MAKNGARGGGRTGATSARSQIRNSQSRSTTTQGTPSARFMDVRTKGGAFKGVRKEK